MHQHLLVSDADHFRVEDEINPWMDRADQPEPAATALTLDAPAPARPDTDREAA
jgi:hypothetical protein